MLFRLRRLAEAGIVSGLVAYGPALGGARARPGRRTLLPGHDTRVRASVPAGAQPVRIGGLPVHARYAIAVRLTAAVADFHHCVGAPTTTTLTALTGP